MALETTQEPRKGLRMVELPLRVRGVGVVGVVTVSGIPQRDDHGMVIRALAELCGVPLSDVALD